MTNELEMLRNEQIELLNNEEFEEKLEVKSWFISKNFNEAQRTALSTTSEYIIANETEKAYYLNALTDYGTISFWCPKSCTYISTYENEVESINNFYNKMQNGLDYNQKLKDLAKANGLKNIRERMTTQTLINKLQAAGIEVPARA